MAFETITPNMGLLVPSIGNTIGPDWANDTNGDWSIVDSHNHTAGNGVAIPTGGININGDLSFNQFNATMLRSMRMIAQASPLSGVSDLGCLYVSGVDLYYNDENGNQIQITIGGGVAGSPGSIANLTSPASASYVALSSTFVWQSDVNTSANMDAASYILRNLTAGSHGLTLNPPNAMAADYALVLPSLPSVTNIMTLDSSGNMGAALNVDNATLAISGNSLEVKTGGITQVQMGALGQQISGSCNTFTTTSATPVDITNLSVSITTTGRPVFVGLIYSQTIPPVGVSNVFSVNTGTAEIDLLRGASVLSGHGVGGGAIIPTSSVWHIDVVTAGTYTYKAQAVSWSGGTLTVQNCALIAYEL